MTALPKSFGFVGLGAMGFPMAVQLRRKLPSSTPLAIYDLNKVALQQFVQATEGCGERHIALSASEVAARAECVITIVPEGAHVKAVYLTPEIGLLATDTSGKLFLDSSTIDTGSSLDVGMAVAASHPSTPPRFYDAPVSGGTAGAEKGSLTFMVGAAADDPTFPLIKQILSFMGTTVNPCGGPSLGLAAKLSNNYLSGLIALATAEAMNMGMRCGLDAKVLSDCFATSSGGSWVNSTVNPVPGVCPDAVTSRDYQGGFKVQLMKKDMSLAVDAARRVGAKLVLADAGLSAYSAASEDPRCRDRDSRVVYRWLGGYEPEVEQDRSGIVP
ncbi:NAD binding domain of 6-phosphogluconate dehydrogenase-domain-containing protein [Gautieria morchelliformis]|nr:NAD binding domain of 6-phosphogluconate dehydrogenase-domain-containing protein [Gautieria morchelliformis]